MGRPRHPDKDIERAVQYAESLGWRVKMSKKGHSWGALLCAFSNREGCQMRVWSTPKNPGNHSDQIRRKVDNCPHVANDNVPDQAEDDEDGNQDIA